MWEAAPICYGKIYWELPRERPIPFGLQVTLLIISLITGEEILLLTKKDHTGGDEG